MCYISKLITLSVEQSTIVSFKLISCLALQGDGVAAAGSDDVALDGGVSTAIASLLPVFEAALQGDGVAVVDSLGEVTLD